MIEIYPSILAADFANLAKEIHKVEGHVKCLHIDVMDGNFVPNLSIGPPVIKSIRKVTSLGLDVHLMVSRPRNILKSILDAGVDNVTLHYESVDEISLLELVEIIHKAGKTAGISISPDTPTSALINLLPFIERILCMTVEPGFGGQSFQMEMLDKIRSLSDMIQKINPKVSLEVDGGITKENAPLVVEAGAQILVAGSAIFGKPDPALAIQEIQNSIKK